MEIKTVEQFDKAKYFMVAAIKSYRGGKQEKANFWKELDETACQETIDYYVENYQDPVDAVSCWLGINKDLCKKFELLAEHILDSREAASTERSNLCWRTFCKSEKWLIDKLGIKLRYRHPSDFTL